MDSGLLVGFWLQMVLAGFAVAAIVHFVFGRWSSWIVLSSAALPSSFDVARQLYPWTDLSRDLAALAAILLVEGFVVALLGAIVGGWLGSGVRSFCEDLFH